MDSPVQTQIREAENRWYAKLRDHCKQIFSGVFLPSHDEVHHSRVWFHARNLLQLIHEKGTGPVDDSRPEADSGPDAEPLPARVNPEELILSVFFHDTGLSKNAGEKHGMESMQLFDEFRESNRELFGQFANSSIQRIRHAIKHHDDKSSTQDTWKAMSAPDLLNLLSSADDMDAYGLLGIYRYAEIYLLRGIKPEDLPARVCANVRNRFENLEKNFSTLPGFLKDQRSRYLQVYEFYLKLGETLAVIDEKPSWEPRLIRTIYNALLKGQNLLVPGREIPETGYDEINQWFERLDLETRYLDPLVR